MSDLIKKEKVIERCKELIKSEHSNWIGISNQVAIEILIDLYKKKSKMVDLMAEHLTTPTHDKEWVIKYFEGEVELEDGN